MHQLMALLFRPEKHYARQIPQVRRWNSRTCCRIRLLFTRPCPISENCITVLNGTTSVTCTSPRYFRFFKIPEDSRCQMPEALVSLFIS